MLSLLGATLGCSDDGVEPDEAAATGMTPGFGGAGGKEDDACEAFVVGVNYAWENFGADFGGLEAWDQGGVRANRAVIRARLVEARAAGATVIRWWMWPDFRGDGVQFSAQGMPLGVTDDALLDLDAVLELSDELGLDLMLCFFSFDGFDPEIKDVSVGHPVATLSDIVREADKRAALVENVIGPVARRVHDSPHASRLVAWDLINEPEWAIEGRNPYGDPSYDPMDRLDAVEHAEMESLLAEMIVELRAADPQVWISVGSAAFKWSQAWTRLDTDFHQFHMYDWIDRRWPHDAPPAAYGLDDKPVYMGEIHFAGLEDASLADVFSSWDALGYLGAMGWSLTDPGDSGQAAGLRELEDAAFVLECGPEV